MKTDKLLPIGTIITSTAVKSEIRNKTHLIITGRFYIQDEEKKRYFDYECNYYPGGTRDGTKLYLNHEYVDKVIHTGFSDERDKEFLKNMAKALAESGFSKSKYKNGVEKAFNKEEF